MRILNPIRSTATPPLVSDKYDGTDRRYEITVVVVDAPNDALVEAYVSPGTQGERLIGTLCPVPGTRDTFQGFWDIPADFPVGIATLTVRLFDRGDRTAQVIATDAVQMNVQHREINSEVPREAVALQWPLNDGPLGFFRSKTGIWKTHISGVGSRSSDVNAENIPPRVQYSVGSLSGEPHFRDFVDCKAEVFRARPDGAIPFGFTCALGAGDLPTSITAISASASGPPPAGTGGLDDYGDPENICVLDETEGPDDATCIRGEDPDNFKSHGHSTDVHRVHPFRQVSSEMQVTISTRNDGTIATYPGPRYPTLKRRVAGDGCLDFEVTVWDRFDQPVPGVNVDAELIDDKDATSFAEGENRVAPDKASLTEPASTCAEGGPPSSVLRQGVSVVPDAPDIKAIESLSGTDDLGRWSFQIFGAQPGKTQLAVWADDEDLTSDTSERPPDDDVREPSEAANTTQAQWLEGPVKLSIASNGDAAPLGSCLRYRLQAAGGISLLDNVNLDLHLRLPDPEVRLCEPFGLRAPNLGHLPGSPAPTDATSDPDCAGDGRPCIHLEGETDEDGELAFGLSSTVSGIAMVKAWVDGEPDSDDDMPAADEVSSKVSTSWVAGPQDVVVNLLTPSVVTPSVGTTARVSSDTYTIVARVNAPYFVESVLIELSAADGSRRVTLGDATRIGHSNLFVYGWDLSDELPGTSPATTPGPSTSPSPSPSDPETGATPTPLITPPRPLPSVSVPVSPSPSTSVSPPPSAGVKVGVPDGTYRIIASVSGTPSSDIKLVEVNRSYFPPEDSTAAYDTVDLVVDNGDSLSFTSGTVTLEGRATSEGVDLFYTTAPSNQSPTWRACGFVRPGTGGIFHGVCELTSGDSATRVTGVAAAAFTCFVPTTGCADPESQLGKPPLSDGVPDPRPREGSPTAPEGGRGTFGASDAVAVFGCDDSPCVSLLPSKWRAFAGTCVPLEARVQGKPGVPSVSQAVVVEYEGPTDGIRFCDPVFGGEWSGPDTVEADPYGPDLHRISGTTDGQGSFVFGVYSEDSLFESIYSQVADAESGLRAWLDDGDLQREPSESDSEASLVWELPNRCTVLGTDASEVLTGTPGPDTICGLGGDDEILAEDGDDVVIAGEGNDTIHGSDGDDSLFGEGGDDTIFGGAGKDKLYGGDGKDDLYGNAGSDLFDGGQGKDRCEFGAGREQSAIECENTIEPEKNGQAPRRDP